MQEQKTILSVVKKRRLIAGAGMRSIQNGEDCIQIRALWIENVNQVLLMTMDCMSNTDAVRAEASGATGLPEENIVVWVGRKPAPDSKSLMASVAAAASEAKANRQPALMSTARDKSFFPDKAGNEDATVSILRFSAEDGRNIELLVNLMLPQIYGSTALARDMEAATGICPVLMLHGAAERCDPVPYSPEQLVFRMAELACHAVNPVATPDITVAVERRIRQLVIGRTIFFCFEHRLRPEDTLRLRKAFPNDRMLISVSDEGAAQDSMPDKTVDAAIAAMKRTVDVSRILPQPYLDAVQEKYLDIHYDDASPQQCMDIWLPNTRPSNALPVIVYFHGGAFAYGWQRGNDVIPMLCGLDRGYAVVSVQYRLSGEARFPAAVYDAKAALRYLRNHAEEYGLDSSRISLWGASAGAWLAAFTAVTFGNPAFEDLTHGPGGDFAPRVRCAVSWCGVLDMSNPGPAPATKEALDKDARSPFSVFLGAPTTTVPQLCRLASPITYVNACSTPPFMLVHGTGDELVPVQQSLSMAQRLKDCCGEGYAELLIENDRPHHGDSWLHEPWVIERCLDFIDRHSGTKGQ